MKRQRWLCNELSERWDWVHKEYEGRRIRDHFPMSDGWVIATHLSVLLLNPAEDKYEKGLGGI